MIHLPELSVSNQKRHLAAKQENMIVNFAYKVAISLMLSHALKDL
jgi:hypothetical protein